MDLDPQDLRDGCDLHGPVDWENASHWIMYNKDDFTVETWCKTGPDYKFRLRTRIRPMTETEVIMTKLRGHTRESIRKAYSFPEESISPIPKKRSRFERIWEVLFN